MNVDQLIAIEIERTFWIRGCTINVFKKAMYQRIGQRIEVPGNVRSSIALGSVLVFENTINHHKAITHLVFTYGHTNTTIFETVAIEHVCLQGCPCITALFIRRLLRYP